MMLKSNVDSIINGMAVKNGVDREKIIADINEAIEAAWNTSDPNVKTFQRKIFGDKKPDYKEIITKMKLAVYYQRNFF